MTIVKLRSAKIVRVSYDVATEVFEGPFDVLLHLILTEEVDLYEISMARIVDGFLAHVEVMERPDLDVTTEFLLIAATLVQLKARRLLPDDDDLTLDEELAAWSERDLLLARLVECKTFKDASRALAAIARAAERTAPRIRGVEDRFADLAPDPMIGVTPDKLRDALARALEPRPVVTIDLDHVAPIRASVAEAVVEIATALRRTGRASFRELTASLTSRLEIVVRFLAILELFKEARVDLDQTERFGDIRITWCGDDTDGGDPLAWHAGFDLATMLVDTYEG